MRPPRVVEGQYFQAASQSSGIRCRGYSEPPWEGRRNWDLAPDQIFGPVDAFVANRQVVSVYAQGSWVLVWSVDYDAGGWPVLGSGTRFAHPVARNVVRGWKLRGWRDGYPYAMPAGLRAGAAGALPDTPAPPPAYQ